jgi:CheY-like chemotaxis protein
MHCGQPLPERCALQSGGARNKSEMKIATNLARKIAAARPKRAYKRAKSKARETGATDKVNPATVLVVDDDPSLLRSLNRLVSASGFHVKTFGRPSELLASETPKSNACMVVDIDLPEITGIEMCEVLKGSGRGLPTILITGRTDARTRSLAAQSDAVAVLFKPFEEEPLLDAIARALALSTRDGSDV